MNKIYRLSYAIIATKVILGLVISTILAVFILIFTYSSFVSILKSISITDTYSLFLVSLTIIDLTLFLIWAGMFILKTVEIDKSKITFKNWFLSKSFLWKDIRGFKVEPYNAFRTVNPGSAVGVGLIRIFNPNYGRGEYLILKGKGNSKYKFYATEYSNSNTMIDDIKRMSK
jgi:hypothetical protein